MVQTISGLTGIIKLTQTITRGVFRIIPAGMLQRSLCRQVAPIYDLRFAVKSDGDISREGIAIDDIHIYDNRNGIYDGSSMSVAATSSAGEKEWINYTSNGALIASVYANNQNLGATDVRVYINSGSIRNVNSQYYGK